MNALAVFWATRSARERALLLGGVACAALVLLYAALWDPGLAARKRLAASLPVMRAQVEDMRAQRKEIVRLRRSAPAAASTGELKSLLQAAAARSAIGGSIERMDALSPQAVRIVAPSASFDAWLLWLAEVQREFGVRVASASIAAAGRPGIVRLEAVLTSGTAP